MTSGLGESKVGFAAASTMENKSEEQPVKEPMLGKLQLVSLTWSGGKGLGVLDERFAGMLKVIDTARHLADKKPNPLRAVAIENSPMILANRQVGGCVFDDIQKLRTMEAHTIRTKETPSEVGTMMAIFSLPVINWLIILKELAAEEKPI